MKLLPRKHAETSREWFGKKGNFITSVNMKKQNKLQNRYQYARNAYIAEQQWLI